MPCIFKLDDKNSSAPRSVQNSWVTRVEIHSIYSEFLWLLLLLLLFFSIVPAPREKEPLLHIYENLILFFTTPHSEAWERSPKTAHTPLV